MTEERRHPLRALLATQFFGAFNDNAWKILVVLLAMRAVESGTDALQGAALETARQVETTWAFVIFTVPLMLFSLPAGLFADRLSKRSLIIAMKVLELALMITGTVILWRHPGDHAAPLVVLGLMGLQSAFFSPAKYGILPELLPRNKLSEGNGALEMWTMLAIIFGTAAGGLLLGAAGDAPWRAGAVLVLFSAAGLALSLRIQPVPPAGGRAGFSETIGGAWRAIQDDRALKLAVLGSAFFWGLASLFGQDILVYARAITDHLPQADALTSAPLAVMGIGLGIGCVLAGKLSAGQIEYGLIPLGAVGLAFFSMLLGIIAPGLTGTLVLLGLFGLSSGLILVPVDAMLQGRAPPERRGAVIALSNVLVFAATLLGSLTALGLALSGLSGRAILIAGSLLTLLGTWWALRLLPDALLRLLLILATNTIYRLKVIDREKVPSTGGVLLVPNHVSLVDGLFLIATIERPVRFIVDAGYFYHPLIRPLFKLMRAIPISSSGGPRQILEAFRVAGAALDEGDVVCIFAEGQITRTGMLLPFRRGLQRIVKDRTAKIVPVNLDRVWGSMFSHSGGRFVTKIPRRIPYPVTVTFGDAMDSSTPLHEMRRAVHELSEVAWSERKDSRRPLHRTFIRQVRWRPWRFAFAEADRPAVSRFKALTGAIAFARKLREPWGDDRRVGILLPPSIAGATANLAASMSGRTSVNFNYTTGPDGMGSAARQSGLTNVLTSRRFLDKAKLSLPDGLEPIWAEDIAASITRGEKLSAALLALCAPARVIERRCGAERPISMDDTATIIFSSGSTGEPKGVMLSQFNIDSNIEGVSQVLRLAPNDRLLGVLPLFHSFGYMALWIVLNGGAGMVFHPNPLDALAIGELVHHHRVTLLLGTPTFLQMYLRRCTPGQFGSLRLVIMGAEKLSQRLADAFEDQFGIRPLEGYGTTECSPVVAVSVPDYRAPGFYQPGSRRQFVGQPLPGVAVRIVDPDTHALLPPLEPGLLLVRGPNVMQGYLGRDDLTQEVIRDGWYVTGDIAMIDEDGFIKITDRLSRFSKIGGEMVPHGKVEEALQHAADTAEQVFAVTSIPHEKKGEELAVLYTLDSERLPDVLERLKEQQLPNLFVPRPDNFVHVDAIPVLGTGKLDLRQIRRVATEALGT